VDIIKTVACYTPQGCGTFGESATGASSPSQCPAFCYTIVITNTGSLMLTNVVVSDSKLDLSGCGFPDTLAVGASASCNVTTGLCVDTHNTASVNANADVDGNGSAETPVTDTDDADAFVQPISIACTKLIKTVDGAEINSPSYEVTLVNDVADHKVTYSVIVTNTGTVDLSNVVISDPDCQPDPTPIASLPVGASAVVDLLCTNTFSCANGPSVIGNTVSVGAQVDVSNTQGVCPYDSNGSAITTAVSTCSATLTVNCETPRPGCRTTGGGKQLTSENQTCPRDVKFVTHGGQVGAPFASAEAPIITNCETGEGTGFNNPCIRGEYQHVRHASPKLKGNFHAAGNGKQHDFDSLQCACLPCDDFTLSLPTWETSKLACHPQDRTYHSLGQLIDNLCNHTVPRSLCGPEPRKASSNKIAFSGVADWTPINGKRSQRVVFRVDLEDRGEPGNAHAIKSAGKKNGPDRYRMRMWFITGDENSAANRALRSAVAVRDATTEVVDATLCNGSVTPEPDIDDGGDLDRGNRQIHPITGATCH
jgi:hypothetical protein